MVTVVKYLNWSFGIPSCLQIHQSSIARRLHRTTMIYTTAVFMVLVGAAVAPTHTAAMRGKGRRRHREFKQAQDHIADFWESAHGHDGNHDETQDDGDSHPEWGKGWGKVEHDDGGKHHVSHGSALNAVTCQSSAHASSYDFDADGHATAVAFSIDYMCNDKYGDISKPYDAAYAAGVAIANAIAESQSDCVSKGNAFGCASASASAQAWAKAHVEVHSIAVAKAIDKCHCLTSASADSLGKSSTFVKLTADAFAHAETVACATGDMSSWATAYSNCAAVAYANLWTKAIAAAVIKGDCYSSDAKTTVLAATGGDYGLIEGCHKDGYAHGYGKGSTKGSDTGGVAKETTGGKRKILQDEDEDEDEEEIAEYEEDGEDEDDDDEL